MTADERRRTLLVIRPTGLGDLLMSLPALRALRRAHPDAELVTTCPAPLVPLAHLAGVADRFVTEVPPDGGGAPASGGPTPLDPSRHRETNAAILDKVFAEPRRGDVETVVVLKMPEDELSRRVLDRRPGRVVLFRHPDVPGTAGGTTYVEDDHILDRWERLLTPAGMPPARADLYLALPSADDGAVRDRAARDGAARDPAPTVLHLGAGSPSRRWPARRWSGVAAGLAADGHRVVFSGSPAERALAAGVAAAAGLDAATNLAGTTDIVQLARLVRSARLVLSTDTGVPHLAAVYRRPSVAIFGPTPPGIWGPPAGSTGHRVLWSGRTGVMYGPQTDPGLLDITAGEVLDAAREVDADPAGTGPDGPLAPDPLRSIRRT